MLTKYLMAASLTLSLGVSAAAAQSCGGTYTVKRGDTLSQIADANYKDARKWSAIYGNNLKKIGDNPNAINVGQKLNLSCIGGLPIGLEDAVIATSTTAEIITDVTKAEVKDELPILKDNERRTIRLLTADDYAPFTDRKFENGGLFNDIVNVAIKSGAAADNYKIYWVNDWAVHLDTLLTDKVMDMGYPWYQADCAATPDEYRCKNFLFADPMFEVLILLFTDKKRPFVFNSDADIIGKKLCRPAGYFFHDLEKNGRNWLRDGKVELIQPVSVEDCFDMLQSGEVDAVAMNEFTGRTAIKTLDLADKVDVVASRPLSIEGLHVIVHKSHPQAEELIDVINTGFKNIKASGEYQKVIDTHMSKIWEDF
jgi:polar amino acid transport system substrate-binding protein